MYDYSKIDKKVEGIIKEVCLYIKDLSPEYIKQEILSAYLYARDAHEGVFRHSGDPYISHPVEATVILLSLKPDIFTIQACFLHDVIEDTPKTSKDIKENFGDEVAFLCNGMEKLSKVKYKGEEREVGSMRKMFVAMAEDVRVIFIKLADRLHNMKTLSHHPTLEKRRKIALETENIYAPIADRLGLYHFKTDLDRECFKILEPEAYLNLRNQLNELQPSRNAFIANAKNKIDEIIKGDIQGYEIDYRVKSIFSIHKKMQKKGIDHVSNLYDLFGMRIIVKDVLDCYKVLGLIHNNWRPMPNRFKDYIAFPKTNGYESIHTTIVGFLKESRKQPTEIQIKTYQMRDYSDIGVAAHFEYKEKGSVISKDIDWVNELKEMTQNLDDSDLIGSLQIDTFKHRIYVFTPQGDSINLPAGSTPVDFAYYVHTDLGNHINMAKVNGNIHPLDKELRNGDMVEILIDKNKKPNPFWLSFLKTVKAKNAVKIYIKTENKDLHRDRGKEIMNKYLEKSGLGTLDKDLLLLKILEGKENSTEERWRLLEQVGNFSITPSILFKRILKTNKQLVVSQTKDSGKKVSSADKKNEDKKIIIGGEAGMSYKFCRCCKKGVPDEIVAHINNKGIFTVHKRDCKILSDVNKKRLLSAYIKGQEEESLELSLNMLFENKRGILKKLSETIYSMEINIDEINSKKHSNSQTFIHVKLLIPNYDYLLVDRLIDRLKLNFGEELIEYNVEKIQ